MLPEHYYKAEHVSGVGNDKAYILETIDSLNHRQKINAADNYSKIYLAEGRRAANNRLRDYAKKCILKNNCCTVQLKSI